MCITYHIAFRNVTRTFLKFRREMVQSRDALRFLLRSTVEERLPLSLLLYLAVGILDSEYYAVVLASNQKCRPCLTHVCCGRRFPSHALLARLNSKQVALKENTCPDCAHLTLEWAPRQRRAYRTTDRSASRSAQIRTFANSLRTSWKNHAAPRQLAAL